jgi:hypothetical protein
MADAPRLVPIDGVVYTGENVDTVGRWLEKHDRRWRYSHHDRTIEIGGRDRVAPMSVIEFEGGAVSVRPVTPVREPAPVHFANTLQRSIPIDAARTTCGRPILDALTGDPILAVGDADRDKVTCDECQARLERGSRHPADVVLSEALERVRELEQLLASRADVDAAFRNGLRTGEARALTFPPSSDMAELEIRDGKVRMHCLVCDTDLPDEIGALNEALVAWREHRKTEREKREHG